MNEAPLVDFIPDPQMRGTGTFAVKHFPLKGAKAPRVGAGRVRAEGASYEPRMCCKRL